MTAPIKLSRSRIRELLSGEVPDGAAILVKGWIRTRRSSKAGLSFLDLVDGSSVRPLQVVAHQSLPRYQEEVLRLTSGCAVSVRGTLIHTPGRPQPVEVRAEDLEVVGWVDDPQTYPIQPKPHTAEYLRGVAHLRPRTDWTAAVMRTRDTLAAAIHQFFRSRGFLWIHTPILTGSDAEGAGALFRVTARESASAAPDISGEEGAAGDFFGQPAYLTVSGQLAAEAYALALSDVYTFGPTFRAELSHTPRHLAEFWMVEPEMAFADLAEDVDLAEAFLRAVFRAVLEERGAEMSLFSETAGEDLAARLERVVSGEFARMSYQEAIEVLRKAPRSFQYPVSWGLDLQTEHERYLAEEHAGRPVVVTDYPKEIKAFYMRLSEDERTVAAMDVLAPGVGEIIGGSQREERLEVLDRRIREAGMRPEEYQWYRDLRRYGGAPHAGFGLGFERALMYVTGSPSIRDVIPFPRFPGSIQF